MDLFSMPAKGFLWLKSRTEISTPQEVEAYYRSLTGKELETFQRVCRWLPTVEHFLRSNPEEFACTQLLLEGGEVFIPKELQPPVTYFDPPWHCYQNSYDYAERNDLWYVEGIALNPTGVLIHAWNSTDGKDVLDYTWPFQHVNKYFGIALKVGYMKEHKIFPGFLGHLEDERKKKKAVHA